jgi:hypothetical protein
VSGAWFLVLGAVQGAWCLFLVLGAWCLVLRYDADVEGVVRAAAAGALALELAQDLLGEPDLRASSHPSAVAHQAPGTRHPSYSAHAPSTQHRTKNQEPSTLIRTLPPKFDDEPFS